MSNHEYSPERALEVLLGKLGERDATLAAVIRGAIDAGKDTVVTEPSRNGRGKPRIYRQTVPFTHEEALQVAVNALQAYFVELPLLINSAVENFEMAAIGIPRQKLPPFNGDDEPEQLDKQAQGIQKDLEIELEPATQISRSQQVTVPLKPLERQQIDDQLSKLKRLAELVNFMEEQSGGDSH
jgi:hypothetical protein